MKTIKYLICIFTLLCMFSGTVSCMEQREQEKTEGKNLVWGVGAPLPQPTDFITKIPEGATVRYAEEYLFTRLGTYQLELIVTPIYGRDQRISVTLTLVADTEAPLLNGLRDISTYVGEGVSYRSLVTLSDNCDGKLDLQVDSSAVNIHKAGVYPVIYTAKDASGNVSSVTVDVYVYETKITLEDLNRELDQVIEQIVTQNAPKALQVEQIYDYVNQSIHYTATSDKNDWIRAAYEGLRTGNGDCFTYFALSKAFFERLGIENMDIRRTEGIVDERHYWNYVNIGSDASGDRWYHYDATPLRGEYHSGCLLTEGQIRYYTAKRTDGNGVGNYFYVYDSTQYPPACTEVINETLPDAG